jgi:aspartate-semialdehyde dehydrogenase
VLSVLRGVYYLNGLKQALGRLALRPPAFPRETQRVFETVAIVGATGAVGTIICQLLAERKFPFAQIKFLASGRSAGKALQFAGRSYTIEALAPESFEGVDLAIGSTPDEVARDFVPWAVERGAVVVDESGYWRMDPNVPLVVPEVNPDAVDAHQGIIASPNCSTTQMVVAMKPLHDAARIRRVIVSTYQATSGMGLAGSQELAAATRAAVAGEPFTPQAFAHAIAFNLIPQIGSHKERGYTSEEMKMVYETRKIMGDESIQVCPTCVRVPVTNCHSESILVETERKLSVDEARALFAATPGIQVVDELAAKRYPMPSTCDGRDDVFIGRIREDLSSPNGLAFWCVSDNLRKGAATNAVQIAELLLRKRLGARGRGEAVASG